MLYTKTHPLLLFIISTHPLRPILYLLFLFATRLILFLLAVLLVPFIQYLKGSFNLLIALFKLEMYLLQLFWLEFLEDRQTFLVALKGLGEVSFSIKDICKSFIAASVDEVSNVCIFTDGNCVFVVLLGNAIVLLNLIDLRDLHQVLHALDLVLPLALLHHLHAPQKTAYGTLEVSLAFVHAADLLQQIIAF